MRKRWSEFLRVRLSLLLTAALVLTLLPVSALATGESLSVKPEGWPTSSWADVDEVKNAADTKPWETRWDSTKGPNSAENPYIIEDEVELILFGQQQGADTEGKFYALKEGQTYNMGAHYMIPLFATVYSGTEDMGNNYFGGTLLGNGAQITNAYIQCFDTNKTQKYAGGLFSQVSGGTVKNLTVTGTMWGGTQYIGGLAGLLTDRTETDEAKEIVIKGTLENCTVEMQFIAPDDSEFFGGLVGSAESAKIEDGGCVIERCKATVKGSLNTSARGFVSVGGLAGQATGSTVTECTATVEGSLGASEVENAAVGSLMGSASESTVSDCEATVEGNLGASAVENASVGGLVGIINEATVTGCKAVVEGDLSAKGASAAVGGLVGNADGSTSIQKGNNNIIQFTTMSLRLNTCSAEVKGSISAEVKGSVSAENTAGSAAAAGGLVGNVNGSTTISKGSSFGEVEPEVSVTGGPITITGCTAEVTNDSISAKGVNAAAGGLAGCVDDRTIINKGNSYSDDSVEVTITGVPITIKDCTFNVTDISAEGANSAAGGLVGHADSSSTVITQEGNVGSAVCGLTGRVTGGPITISGTANVAGSISASGTNSAAGGLVGHADGSTSVTEITGYSDPGDLVFNVQRSPTIAIGGTATVAGHISAEGEKSAVGGLVGHANGSTGPVTVPIHKGSIIIDGDTKIAIRGGTATARTGTGGPQGAVGGSQNTTITFSDSSTTTLTLGNGGVGVTLTDGDKAASVSDTDMTFTALTNDVQLSLVKITDEGPELLSPVTLPKEAVPFTVTSDGKLTLPDGTTKYFVAFDSQGGSPVGGQLVADGGTITEPADLSLDGCTFGGWYTEPECVNQWDFSTPVTKSTTLYAKWTVTITTNVTPEGSGHVTGGGEVLRNTQVTLTANAEPGFTFKNWRKGKTDLADQDTLNVYQLEAVADVTITAVFEAAPASGDYDPPTYRPEIEKPDGGTVSISPKNPEKGDTVTIYPRPEPGREVENVIVTDKNGKPVEVTDNGDGTFSFKQPSGKVTIAVTFADKQPPAPVELPFTDVPAGAWYEGAVRYVYEKGMMEGTSATIFDPGLTTSRAMLAKVLHNLENNPDHGFGSRFDDVANGQWYSEAVSWAADWGIVSGYPDGSFGPDDPVSREQLAVMLWNYAGKPAADKKLGFKDADQISGYAQAAIQWAVENGILSGKGGNVLDPKGQATRAEVASMLMRFCENIK